MCFFYGPLVSKEKKTKPAASTGQFNFGDEARSLFVLLEADPWFLARNVHSLFFYNSVLQPLQRTPTLCQIRAGLSGALTSEPEVFTAY